MAALDKGKNYLTPNEGRLKLNLKPVTGGDTVYRQQQDFSLEALNKRDSQPDPFSVGEGHTEVEPAPQATEERLIAEWRVKAAALEIAA
jgi:phage portal protein BeeE